ncbi:MAG: calcium/sodium antiporter [Candidatus Lambdaproteobacteria bacterium]|nr:calcium/sodium antiporter [Candidatus Lambdaproteobacteria bacterium]
MILAIALIVAGLALLVVGGDFLVRGASGIALLARVTPTVVGLTIVAAGTSMPEMVVSLQAAFAGSPAMAMGNVVGSNIFNIAAILGIAALIAPLRIQGNTVRLEWPVMMLSAFQLHLLARDGVVDRLEGGFFLVALTIFMTYTVWIGRRQAAPVEQAEFASEMAQLGAARGKRAWLYNSGQVGLGVALLVGGSTALVHGCITIAHASGVSEAVIGLTIVAAGTSLPELATSAVASWRRQDDIAVANVIGSNIFNVLAIVGLTAAVQPLPVPAEIIARDNWWMLGLSVLLFPLMRSGMRITRAEGAVLLAAFGTYMTVLVASL